MSDDQQQPPTETPEETPYESPATNPQPPGQPIAGADKKMLAGLLAIFLGWIGVHKFILDYQKEGKILAIVGGVLFVGSMIPVIQCITAFLLPAAWLFGLIEGIIYLTKSDEEFVNTYITNKKPWF